MFLIFLFYFVTILLPTQSLVNLKNLI